MSFFTLNVFACQSILSVYVEGLTLTSKRHLLGIFLIYTPIPPSPLQIPEGLCYAECISDVGLKCKCFPFYTLFHSISVTTRFALISALILHSPHACLQIIPRMDVCNWAGTYFCLGKVWAAVMSCYWKNVGLWSFQNGNFSNLASEVLKWETAFNDRELFNIRSWM